MKNDKMWDPLYHVAAYQQNPPKDCHLASSGVDNATWGAWKTRTKHLMSATRRIMETTTQIAAGPTAENFSATHLLLATLCCLGMTAKKFGAPLH